MVWWWFHCKMWTLRRNSSKRHSRSFGKPFRQRFSKSKHDRVGCHGNEISTHRYFKLGWNTTRFSQSPFRNVLACINALPVCACAYLYELCVCVCVVCMSTCASVCLCECLCATVCITCTCVWMCTRLCVRVCPHIYTSCSYINTRTHNILVSRAFSLPLPLKKPWERGLGDNCI